MQLFEHLDNALLKLENRKARVSRSPSIGPSQASAELFNTAESKIIGKCHRASYWTLIGEPIVNPVDPIGARRFRVGRAIEADITECAKVAGIFGASGVRHYVEDVQIPLELDLVLVDPEGHRQGFIGECKSIYGYVAGKTVIKEGKPKLEAVMQLALYLNEFRTGARLKEVVAQCEREKEEAKLKLKDAEIEYKALMNGRRLDDAQKSGWTKKLWKLKYRYERIRLEYDPAVLGLMYDGPLLGKLAYETRDDCSTREFDIGIWEDPIDGLHYATIDGEPYMGFCLESIYERHSKLQSYYNRALEEAFRVLNVTDPPEDDDPDASAFWEQVGDVMRTLPLQFLPPAEYEWRYSDDKIRILGEAGIIGKTKYNDWLASQVSKRGKRVPLIGSWACNYCPYSQKCIAMEYPDMRETAVSLMAQDEAA